MQPLVLAIEPDLRQAAIVKRIVREKVLAEVTVVDSRDAALEAMRTMVPDVLLLSALLSPRDEDELIAHLRTLEHAEHLQTHTIPQLASAIGQDGEKPSRGLLSAFRRRKAGGSAPAGCDPDLFADEVRTYLQRASEKKREVRDAAVPAISVAAGRAAEPAAAAADDAAAGEPAVTSSWASPFEWRPSKAAETKTKSSPPPAVVAAPPPAAVAVPPPAPAVEAAPEVILAPVPVVVARVKRPLVKRQAHEWWFEDKDTKGAKEAKDTDSDLAGVLASLSVPLHVAAFAYPEGCRIRRVRVAST